jgi:hypothetical protein
MPNNFIFNIGSQQFSLEDLGQLMNSQFQNLYEYYFSGRKLDLDKFRNESINFFDQNYNNYAAHDKFFNNFTIIWELFLQQGSFFYAEQLWQIAIEIAKKWEDKNQNKKKIHKSAPYYFWGVTCILKEDLEKGFLLMHQALEEDKQNIHSSNLHNTPAYAFVTLDYQQQKQYFRNKVLEIARFAEEKLNHYQTSRNGKLTNDTFKSIFLENLQMIEQVFLFIFELFHVKKLLSENRQGLTQNVYGSMLMTQSIFTLGLLIDNIIKQKYNNLDPHKQQFIDLLVFLSQKAGLKMDKAKLQECNNKHKNDFQSTLDDLINSRPIFKNNKLQPIEEDIAIIYGFRNSAAHKIRDRPFIHENFGNIINRVFNVFFFAIEKLY